MKPNLPMKIFADFLALILFFLTYWYTKDVRLATAVAVVIGIIQAGYSWFKFKKLETMQWISLGLIVVFGGATIILNNPVFIMWKPSLLFWAMGLSILISHMVGKNGIKLLLGKELTLPEFVWKNLAYIWTVFFLVMGLINLAVAYQFSFDQWVTYKTFGSMGLMFVFFVAQSLYLAKYLPKASEK